MRNKTVSWVLALAVGLGLWVFPSPSHAAERSVRAALPGFQVTLNGNAVENQYREYPLLIYKDITYFPMTWYDCRLLGLETAWSQEDGLAIAQADVASSYEPYKTSRKNPQNVQATVPDFSITVNGKTVNNAEETYPLLSYRDVVYFPLTWKFAHDEFGWQYEWDSAKGLSIASGGPQIRTLSLPEGAGENGTAVFKGYVYFVRTEGTTNTIYRAPADDPASREPVYSYELDTSYGPQKNLSFSVRGDELWFIYHRGGATMGSNVYGRITEDGKAAVEHQGYLDFREIPEGWVIVNQSVPPSGSNLRIQMAGQDDRWGSPLGKQDLIYGWHITHDAGSTGYGAGSSTTVVGENVYVLASPYPVPDDDEDLNRIYLVNRKTNDTRLLVDDSVNQFKIRDNKLYYVKDADGLLYSSDLDGSGEQRLSDNKAPGWFDVVGGSVYYTVGRNPYQGPFQLYRADPDGEDPQVIADPVEEVRTAGGKLVCRLAAGGDYGIKILDSSGAPKLAVADKASGMFVYGDSLLFVSAENHSVRLVNLQ
jgi:hypothetical protein